MIHHNYIILYHDLSIDTHDNPRKWRFSMAFLLSDRKKKTDPAKDVR